MTRIMHMIVPVLEDSTAQQWAQAHEKTTVINMVRIWTEFCVTHRRHV